MMWLGLIQDNLSSQILSVDGACLSLVTSVVPTPVKTISELFGPAFRILPKTDDAELDDQGKPG